MKLSPEQLKGRIRLFSNKNSLRPQEVLQMFMFEQLLSRIENSVYRNNFIIKGGVLIASFVGVESRTTMDLDTTVKGIEMKEEYIKKVIVDILKIKIDDSILFEFQSISNIREEDDYDNFRVYIQAKFGKMSIPMKIDITTGDIITPKAIDYMYPKMFETKCINIKAYPLATILAEKYESVLKRNITTTRIRDFYDLYLLYKTKKELLDINVFRLAVINTATKRGSMLQIYDWKSIIEDIRDDYKLKNQWINYLSENKYISDINYDELVECMKEIAIELNITSK